MNHHDLNQPTPLTPSNKTRLKNKPAKMTTQTPNPLPPTTVHTTTPIAQSAAHDFLAAYLDRAGTDPALQPNAGISEHGPVSRTTASAPNLILHNLKRVQAGLGGETLGRDLTMVRMDHEGDKNAHAGADAGADAQGDGDVQGQGQGQEGQDMEMVVEDEADDAAGGIDKEERKRKKKERRLAEKKAKA